MRTPSPMGITTQIKHMPLPTKLSTLGLASCLLITGMPAMAANTLKIPVSLRLTHVADGRWRADYHLNEPVSSLSFDQLEDYRETAWKIITPGSTYRQDKEHDMWTADQPVTDISLEISSYGKFLPKNYAPNNRFTDGGAAIYMGFFKGNVLRNKQVREMELIASYQGLPGDTVIPPPHFKDASTSLDAYAYFGPQKPQQKGATQVVMDPGLPPWFVSFVLDVSSKASSYYQVTYQRPLLRELFQTMALADLDTPGLSLKGGATNGQINYRIGGKALLKDSPQLRAMVAGVVVHEMAHIWQTNISQGGIGDEPAWIHEGGAEAMAVEALQSTGIWTAEQAEKYKTNASAECDKLKNGPPAYRRDYACGLQYFMNMGAPTPIIWRALIEETDKTGEVYSEAMLERLKLRLAKP